MQTMEAGGGSERRCGDATVEAVMPQPAEATTEQQGGAAEAYPADPLLFQGSRFRAESSNQAGASGNGSAEYSGISGGEVGARVDDVEAPAGVFQTPRSRRTRTSLMVDAARQPPLQQHGALPGWMTKLGEFFRGPTVTWLPSPLPSPSPPAPRRQEIGPGQSVSTGRQVLEHAASSAKSAVVRGALVNPNASTPSSSELPTEAIQAEVQRQLGGLIDRLQYMESENQRLQDQLARVAAERTQVPEGPLRDDHRAQNPGVWQGPNEPREDPDQLPHPRAASWTDPLGALWGDWRPRREKHVEDDQPVAAAQTQAPAGSSVKDSFHESTNAMLDVLARSMTQLQDMQAKTLQKNLDDDAPENVKSSVPVLPLLIAPEGISTGITLQDWQAQISVAMQDLSPSSGEWWGKVMDVVQRTYAKWLGSTPLERIQLQPQGHLGLSTGKWTRVNARACTMLLQSLTDAVKQDLIARRVVQHATLIMFRLHTVYQPGGASEKTLVLNSLQSPTACETLDDVLVWLRSWPRWIQRCQDLSMQCPDGTVLAKALSSATAKFIVESGDAQFRTQLLRSTLRIDGQPSLDDVKRYHQHLQAELEALSVSRTIPTTPASPSPPKVRMAATTGSNDKAGTSPTSGNTTTKQPCKYFFKQTGCRRGAKCPYGHDMNALTKAERSKKCLCCGSEEHRQRDCPTKNPKAPMRTSSSSATTGNSSATTSSTTPRVNRLEPEGEASPNNSSPPSVVTGEPVWTLESLLEAASKVASAKAAASSPSLNVVSLRAHYPMSGQCCTFALVDSGATHALRRAESEEEWQCADPVVVNLAGGESVALRINQAGTILVPLVGQGSTSSASAPIVPLGALVGQLGYSMMWSGTKCKLEGRNGEVLNLRVRDGCPEIAERDALRLIAMLEDKQLQELKNNTATTRRKVKAAAMMMERTWFDHLQSYTASSISTEALKAVEAAPFFRDIPRQCLAGLVEAVPELNGWEALKGLEHLNRRTRKRLWSSDKWLVHLFAGEREKKDWAHLERAGYTILELDITRGRTHDILRPSTWRVLEYAARKGKIAAIIGGPPQGTFMISRYNVNGPRPLRTNDYPYGGWSGQSDADVFTVNRETKLVARMIYLHALSTAGRLAEHKEPSVCREVGFLLEHPRDPRGYLKFNDPLYPDVVSLWRMPLWTEYALEAGLNTYSLDMAAMGKAYTKFVTCGTNLQLRHLDRLRTRWYLDGPVPEPSPACVWPTEFIEHVVLALKSWGLIPRMVRMSAEQWRDHVRRGHLPYRADCTVCVQAGGTGRRHSRVEHPSAYVLSSDLAGPVKVPGTDPDARGAYPKPFKYIFVAKLRVPRTFVEDGRGTWVEYDDGEVDEDKYEEQDDGLNEDQAEAVKESIRPTEAVEEEQDEEEASKKLNPEEDLDLAPPELVNLIFSTGLRDDKSATVLEAIQDVVLYCQSLNIPVLRFHSDRGMEYQARAVRQWLKGQGIRVTTSEAGVHQTNGAAESTVRWVKQRARTLLLSAGLPQHLWPTAISTAATLQRADVLGFEPKLAAPYGAKVVIRKRQLEGPKQDDLVPKWIHGTYVGLSESLSKGHLVFVKDGDGEKFIHTLHVRAALHDPGPIADVVEADEPAGPSHRVRGKASGSGDVVTVSKAVIFEDELYKQRAEKILDSWSQEEAEALVKEVGSLLPPAESVYGMFRHGGRTGITRATVERPWFAQLLIRLLRDRAPDAEFASIYVSVNSEREVHIDRNNAMGTLNYLLPIITPRRGGEIWQELRNGDTVSGRITELTSPDGKVRYGCAYPLQEGSVFHLNPHRRHAVLPYKGERVVVVGYTPGVLQNVTRTDREFLWTLGFPMPVVDEDGGGGIRISMLSVGKDVEAGVCPESCFQEEHVATALVSADARCQSLSCHIQHEEWADWEMRLLLDRDQKETVLVESDVRKSHGLYKAEVSYTENIEQLLEALGGPLNIVHTVSPRDAADHFQKWVPSLEKEIASLAHAVQKAHVDDEEVRRDVETGEGQMIPMKVVFTVKPPDANQDGASATPLYKRKSRIVICGNLATHQPGEVYTNTAPAEVVRAAIAVARYFNWNLGMIDVVAAFLQTPLKELSGAPLVYGVPPKILIKAGLCRPGELWKLTHAVYGLQESPNLWGTYRDQRLAEITFMIGDKTITLVQGKVEPSWWSVMQDGTVLVGILVVYVDDLLICGEDEVIKGLTAAIRSLWKTSELQLVSEGTIRFLGIEISEYKKGFALSQSSYIEELVRLHNIPASRKDLIPVAKDQATFLIEEDEKIFTVAELRTAQQCAGELLWVSQRTRPDISYVASLVGSLATRAPRRAIQIAEKAIAYLQRTMSYSLIYQTDGSGLVAYCDASFAPEGGRSHSGWIVLLHDCVIAWRSGRQATVTLSTAEAELMAMSEAVLALQSTDSMMKDMFPAGQQLQLYSDSTSALAIANGSGSWRTRHLRLRSAWVAELISNRAMTVHHCVGEVQPADLLTKALASQRIKSLCCLLNLRDTNEENYAGIGEEDEQQTSNNSRSSIASAPNQIPKVLIALLVLSQAVLGESHEWEREDAFMVTSSLSVDYGMITWALLWSAVIVFLLAWELVKWLVWLLYDRATPGSKSRRLKRLKKLREATADAIQREIQSRAGSSAEQRARDSQIEASGQRPNPPRTQQHATSSTDTADERLQLLRKLARGVKETSECGVQAGAFEHVPPPADVRVILRYVHEPPEDAYVVPGNECYHVYQDCFAFRHRGTLGRVEHRRICQYCLNRTKEDPDKSADYFRDLERAREYETLFNTTLRTSGQQSRGSGDAP